MPIENFCSSSATFVQKAISLFTPTQKKSSAISDSLKLVQLSTRCLNKPRLDTPTEKAAILARFLKKCIAAQSYGEMFSKGEYFKKVDDNLPESKTHGFSTIEHLHRLSRRHLQHIKGKTKSLTKKETQFLEKVINSKITLRHQTNANLGTEKVNLFSHEKLKKSGIAAGSNTRSADIYSLKNNDFVFFAMEFNNEGHRPLNGYHGGIHNDFGANAYLFDEISSLGYMTLTDHFFHCVSPGDTYEHKDFLKSFSQKIQSEVGRYIEGEKGYFDRPIYTAKDMKLAIGLHIIDFIRKSKDSAFKRFVLSPHTEGRHIDHIINFLFHPEFHVPRMMSTSDYRLTKLRPIDLEEAIDARNISELDMLIKTQRDAIAALGMAVVTQNKDVMYYLFTRFDFTREDVKRLRMRGKFYDIEYCLSTYYSDTAILEEFLKRGLAKPNHRITISNETMLDKAIRFNKTDMVALLKKYGAISN